MKNYFILLALAFTLQSAKAQFDPFALQQKLFDHPVEGFMDFPFIPMDYNKDGKTDYISRIGDFNVAVYQEDEEGFFFISDNIAVEPYAKPYQTTDFYVDGYQDIVMEGYLLIYNENTGDYDPLYLKEGDWLGGPTIMGVADFDGDGLKDVLTTNSFGSSQNNLQVQIFDGVKFTPKSLINDIELGPIEIGDLEGDGDIDIAVVNKYELESPALYINDGTGDFKVVKVQGNQILSNRTLDFNDIDNDGDLDLLVRNIDNELMVYENTDNFQTPPNRHFVAVQNSLSAIIEDFDEDGIKEIATLNFTLNNFSVELYYQDGELNFNGSSRLGTFPSPSFFLTLNPNYTQQSLISYDTDYDGDKDIIMTFGLGNNPAVHWFENRTLSPSGIDETKAEKIDIFPNPSSVELNISNFPNDAQGVAYTISNVMGQEVKVGNLEPRISIEELAAGNYFLSYYFEDKLHATTFVVQR